MDEGDRLRRVTADPPAAPEIDPSGNRDFPPELPRRPRNPFQPQAFRECVYLYRCPTCLPVIFRSQTGLEPHKTPHSYARATRPNREPAGVAHFGNPMDGWKPHARLRIRRGIDRQRENTLPGPEFAPESLQDRSRIAPGSLQDRSRIAPRGIRPGAAAEKRHHGSASRANDREFERAEPGRAGSTSTGGTWTNRSAAWSGRGSGLCSRRKPGRGSFRRSSKMPIGQICPNGRRAAHARKPPKP